MHKLSMFNRFSLTIFAASALAASSFAENYIIVGDGTHEYYSWKEYSVYAGGSTAGDPVGTSKTVQFTKSDTITMVDFYDVKGASFDVADFKFISDMEWGANSSWYDDISITAENINFYAGDTSRGVDSINLNSGTVVINGSFQSDPNVKAASVNLGQAPHIHGTNSLTFGTYAEGTTSRANINNINIVYGVGSDLGGGGDTEAILTINGGSQTYVNGIYNKTSEYLEEAPEPSGPRVYTTTININGGELHLGSFNYAFDTDDVTINHTSGVLAANSASNVLSFSRGELGGSLKYVLGQNAVFDVSVNNISLDSTVALSAAEGVSAGFTVRGANKLILGCGVDAVSGAVRIESGASLESAWLKSASEVSVGAGSVYDVSGDIELSGASKIVLDIAGADSFGKIATDFAVVGSEYGVLEFVVSASAFEESSSITLSLTDLISASGIDWDNFDIRSNMEYSMADGNITFVVPEPAEWGMLFGGLAILLALAFRRKRG